jgi:RNA-binding protein NOB1
MADNNNNNNQNTPVVGDEPEVHDPSVPKPVKITAPPAWPKKSTNLNALNDSLSKVAISKKPETKLVVDTGAFIAKVRIDNLAQEFWTVPEVLSEIKDSSAKEWLAFLTALNVKLNIRQPSPEAYNKVIAFSKKTGDYASLSAVDLKVIALTLTLETEVHGTGDHIRSDPVQTQPRGEKKQKNDLNMFVLKSKIKKAQETTNQNNADANEGNDDNSSVDTNNTSEAKEEKSQESNPQVEAGSNNAAEDKKEQQATTTTASSDVGSETSDLKDIEIYSDEESSESDDENVGFGDFEDNDDGGWITTDNVDAYTKVLLGTQLVGEQEEADRIKQLNLANPHVKVACLTTDFAIQNVLLQMGLSLFSIDGFSIRSVQRWVLQCWACHKICKDVTKVFCPMCGNNTLRRVAYTVDKDGNVTYHIPRRKVNMRGTRYSIPKPKGGRNNKDLILSEAQLPRRYYGQNKKGEIDGFETSTLLQSKNTLRDPIVVGYGRRNPNEPRKRYGKKNKSKRPGY